MPDLPKLNPVDSCPDSHCEAPIGRKHTMDCLVAVCVTTGQQRILHAGDPPPLTAGLHVEVDAHICGDDVWAGWPHGAVEAAAYGLFVRHTTDADAGLTGWIPCDPGEPGAVPDLDRLARSGTWNPIRQVWEMPAEVAGRG